MNILSQDLLQKIKGEEIDELKEETKVDKEINEPIEPTTADKKEDAEVYIGDGKEISRDQFEDIMVRFTEKREPVDNIVKSYLSKEEVVYQLISVNYEEIASRDFVFLRDYNDFINNAYEQAAFRFLQLNKVEILSHVSTSSNYKVTSVHKRAFENISLSLNPNDMIREVTDLNETLLDFNGDLVQRDQDIEKAKKALNAEDEYFIKVTYKTISSDGDISGRDWHILGRDKYGRIAICFETKEKRGLTIGEFYGGGVVD